MHALVTAVLLRFSRCDALDGDAQAQPPDRQFRQIVETVGRGKGQAVVAPDGGGKAALGKQALERVEGIGLFGRFMGLAQKQLA